MDWPQERRNDDCNSGSVCGGWHDHRPGDLPQVRAVSRLMDTLPKSVIPAADDRMVIAIREGLRDLQAQPSRSPLGRAVTVDSHSAAVLQAGPL